MAVSPLLNDLALAAATDRTAASRKATQKGSDANFSNTLSETRRENGVANTTAIRPHQGRPHAKLDPREPRNSEAPQSHAEKHDLREAKPHERQNDVRKDDQQRGNNATDDRGLSGSQAKSSETEATIGPSTGSENQGTDPAASSKQSISDSTVQSTGEATESIEAVALDASALIQTVLPQPLTNTAIPVDVQIAALATSTANAALEGEAKKASETSTDVSAVAEGDSTGLKADISAVSSTQAAVQTQAEAKTAQLSIEVASETSADISAVSTQAKSAVSVNNAQAESKATLASLETSQPQTQSSVGERSVGAAEQTSTKQTFNETLTTTTSQKTNDGITGLSAGVGSGNAETPQAVRTPASSPSEGLSRADSPVPLQAVAVEIGMRAMRGSKEFSIRLDPEDLGRIDIRLEISEAGEVQAKMTVDRVETLQLLQRDAKTLERAFDQAGLKSNPDGLQFSLRDPGQQGNGQNQQSERPKFNGSEKDLIGIEDTPISRSFRYPSPATSGLDIRI